MASELRANTEIMRNGANSITNGGEIVGQATNNINAVGNGIGSPYDGQLQEKLAHILSHISTEGNRLHIQSQNISETLSIKASEIDAVMQSQDVISMEFSQNDIASSPLRSFFSNIREYGVIATFLSIFGIDRKSLGNSTKYTTHIPENMTAPGNMETSKKNNGEKPRSPVDYEYKVSAGFPKYGDGTLHSGMDILPSQNTDGDIAVKAIGPGKVVKVSNNDGGYGNYIVIEHKLSNEKNIYSLYAHLDKKPSIREGEIVDNSTTLGNMGSSGRSTGTHLHLQIMKSDHISRDFSKVNANAKIDLGDSNSMTWKEKMLSEVYSPQDVLNSTGNAQGWKFIIPE
jgi:murein DD-endopeptidase MepM/ murein hydrolase activator NlpD